VASNFEISVHRKDENIHLKLAGNFDESSAHELLNALKRHCCEASSAFIHTSCLKQIHPSGRDALQSNLHKLNGKCISVVFTGDKADQLTPEGNRFF
jgi:hypothetical protein